MDSNQVLPQVYVGSYPTSTEDADRLRRDLGITAVLNLQTDEDFAELDVPWAALDEHYRGLGIELRRIPARDFDQEDLRRKLPHCVETLSRLLDDGHTVYVHCTAGMGRSPTVVVAYLHWVEGWDLDEAARHVIQCRPSSPDVRAIQSATRPTVPNGRSGRSGPAFP
jgi:protein-tyrosine phosphatase